MMFHFSHYFSIHKFLLDVYDYFAINEINDHAVVELLCLQLCHQLHPMREE